MKVAVLSLAAISLAQFVYAQPHGNHGHAHAHAHGGVHGKRAVVTLTETAYAEATGNVVGEVVVLVDQKGQILSTATNFVPIPTPATTPAAASPVVSSSKSSSVATTKPTTPATPATGPGFGVAYNPYDASGNCKSQGDVASDMSKIAAAGYTEVRIYGSDCNGVVNVYPAAKSHGMTLIVGVFDIYNINSEVASIVAGVQGDWSSISACLVGNERVNTGTPVGTVLGAVAAAKTLLRNAGFNGFVATADTMVATIAHPELCTHDDNTPCYTNDHPFFNSNSPPSGAGSAILADIAALRAVLANPYQTIIISETGYPNCGETHGVADPSPAGQSAALAAIKSAFGGAPGAVFLLTPTSSAWKNDFPGSYGAEKCWGFM